MVLSKMAKPFKKPAAAKATPRSKATVDQDVESGKKGSMNECIKRMKSSAALAIKDKDADDGEDMDVDEEGEGDSVARDKGFALKFQRMKKDLPAYVVDLVESQSAKAAHPREFKSRMINKLFTRESW